PGRRLAVHRDLRRHGAGAAPRRPGAGAGHRERVQRQGRRRRLQRRRWRRGRRGAARARGAGLAAPTQVEVAPMLTTIVVPCFNEAAGLQPDGFTPLVEHGDVELLFVDDGSTDDTRRVIEDLAARWPRTRALAMPANVGKGEAVRRGMLDALARGA